ncbi:MAG: hypothetical protein ACRDPC_19285, partial [Solirubrobacteraceae bacterium]
HDEQEAEERKRAHEPAPDRRACRPGLVRAAEANLNTAVLARLNIDVACSLETHLGPRTPSGHGYAVTLTVG